MIKKLTAHGNSSALVIEKPILELLKMTPDTPVEIQTDGQRLIITPIFEESRENTIEATLARLKKKTEEKESARAMAVAGI